MNSFDSYAEDRYGPRAGDRQPVCDPVDLARRLESGDPAAAQEFSQYVEGGVCALLRRHLLLERPREEAEVVLRNAIQAIRRGELRRPEKLWEFLLSQVRRHIAEWKARHPAQEAPVRSDSAEAQVKVMASLLRQMSPRDLEALQRFYALNQTEGEILQATGMTKGEWHSLKAASKTAFRETTHGTGRGPELPDRRPRSPWLRQSA